MNLPDPKLLEDARWQQDYAGRKVAEFVDQLRKTLETPPADTDAARARHERTRAFVRALEFFFETNAALLGLLDQREEEMNEEMGRADFIFRQMRLDRDFYLHELQYANTRYYQENDLSRLLSEKMGKLLNTPPAHA